MYCQIEGVIDFFGIDRDIIVAAGDSLPDIAMMRAAGWAICPGNAEDCVIRYLSEKQRAEIGEGICCDGISDSTK